MDTVANLIYSAIEASPKRQKEIAHEAGWRNPNFLSMVKHGAARLPFGKIHVLAAALGIDPLKLLRVALVEYAPEFAGVVVYHIVLSTDEAELLKEHRALSAA